MISPSYISFESALSYRGLIPEAVYTTTSACLKRARRFASKVGLFSFTPIPARAFMEEHGVEVIDLDLPECVNMMNDFIAEKPALWNEDIGEL